MKGAGLPLVTKSLPLPSSLLLGSVRAAARMVEQEAKMGLWGSPGVLPASTPTHTPHTIYLTALGTLQHRYLGELSMCHTQLPVPRGYQSPNEVSLESWTSQPGIVCNSNLLQCLCSLLTCCPSLQRTLSTPELWELLEPVPPRPPRPPRPTRLPSPWCWSPYQAQDRQKG